ncbi:transcription regulator HTH, apses-type DNA-binding domain-containing protein, partial [Protomyces lactucae-debilis]
MAAAAHAAALAAHAGQQHPSGPPSSGVVVGGQGFAYPRDPDALPFDPTGQQCPPGGRPRVSTTIWEDEGTLCFQVEALQVTVARREADDNMINGTKLLNVAQMSRGKRDGILKNEPDRKVIKVGSMHLKGVWIPFDRALDLANRYAITDALYPLFVQDIKKFL